GGTWGTVTLLLDASPLGGNSLSQVRLGYRDWDPAVNPTAGEASVAEQFLQYVLNRYVPATEAARLRTDFWEGSQTRVKEAGTKAEVKMEEGQGFVQRWLVIQRPQANTTALTYTTTPAIPAPWRQPADGGLLRAPTGPVTVPAGGSLPQAPVNLPLPLPAPQQGLRREAPLQVPANAPAGPQSERGAAPKSFLESAASTLRGLAGLPDKASPSAPMPPLADFDRLHDMPPAQESRYRPTPPPPISSSLVPAVETVINNRPVAPSNFAAYNEAEQLTKDIEARALEMSRNVSASVAVASTTLQVAPLQAPQPLGPATQPATPAQATAAPQTPTPPADPRFAPSRDLPQLRFIPKAEPLDTRNEVIRFEDEGSGL
ncbi:MAG: hypothetical protein INF43_02970, partial [Alphaproteobacteria bacterium]|nr:hypothetical protein [Alphaproteobacteria bacterium]